MRGVDDIVIDACEIDIIDRKLDIAAAAAFRNMIFFDVFQTGKQDTRQLGLQYVITYFLQLGIQGEPYIVSGRRFHPGACLDHLAQIIDEDSLRPFPALQLHFHGGFDAGLADRIIQRIGFILLLQSLQLFRIDLSGITDDLCKVDALVVFADRALRDGHTLQHIGILHHHGHRLLGHIVGYRRGDITLVTVGTHGKTDRDDL